jgi:hypothetical protein
MTLAAIVFLKLVNTYRMWYIRYMDNPLEKILSAKFYITPALNWAGR